MAWLAWLLDWTPFSKRSQCGPGWAETPWLEPLHVASDATIATAYLLIPFVMVWSVWRLRRMNRRPPETRLILLYGAFIVCCGLGHGIDALMFETPLYRLLAFVKAITALVSAATALHLLVSLPRLIFRLSHRPEDYLLERLAGKRNRSEG